MAVVVVGPPGAGKTTVSRTLAEELRLPLIQFDADPVGYYRPFGYTFERSERWYREGGAEGLHRYECRFEARALERAVRQHGRAVIDVGGGVLRQYTAPDSERVRSALARAETVILAIPFPRDPAAAHRELVARLNRRGERDPEVRTWLETGGTDLLRNLLAAALSYADQADVLLDTGPAHPVAVRPARRRTESVPARRPSSRPAHGRTESVRAALARWAS